MQARLRKIKKEDCIDLYYWRNDIVTRRSCFNSKIISYRTHREWFKNSLANRQRYLYIVEDSKRGKIGVLRVDRLSPHVAEISINLAPNMRGKGYGAKLLQQMCRKFIHGNQKIMFLARIKKENLASLRVFKKAGFNEVFTYRDAICGSDILVMEKI